jgi:hypothetical protein
MVTGSEIAIVAIVFGAATAIITPVARAFAKRIERRDEGRAALAPDLTERLERIERAVDAIAVEVERISEGQRFVTQIMSDRTKPPSLGAGPQ